jgi:hypothetical protein
MPIRSPSRHSGLRRSKDLLALALTGVLLAGCGGEEASDPTQPESQVELPLQQIADVEEAAEAAGCELVDVPEEGREHAEREFRASDYETNPPTSGTHDPQWYEDGIYEPGATPSLGMLVHTLEHGRINVQYAPDTPEETVDQLEALLAETEGYHMLLYENATDMEYQVAATAWTKSLGCPEMNPQVFDALRTFRTTYIDQAPERVP